MATRRASSRRPSSPIGRPSSAIVPPCATSPATARSSVVFPAPFGPISVTHSPCSTENETPSTTFRPPSSTDDAVERERDHDAILREVRSTTAKNGAPKNAVTTPIGSSAGESAVRAITSASTRNPAPTSTESGSSSR